MEPPALEVLLGAALTVPHAKGDPQGVLELLEPLAERREGEAETLRLGLVPGRADAQPGAPTG